MRMIVGFTLEGVPKAEFIRQLAFALDQAIAEGAEDGTLLPALQADPALEGTLRALVAQIDLAFIGCQIAVAHQAPITGGGA